MRLTYQSDHANQLHQLLVSISKHLYRKKDGLIAYQEKPFEATFDNYRKSQKEHLVYYILRDHYSGNFVFKIATVQTLFPLAAFLYETWNSEGEDGLFRGMPEVLWVPKTIATAKLFDGLKKLLVKADFPPSGFASGIRVIRDIEDHLCYWLGCFSDHTLENMVRHTEEILRPLLINPLQGNKRDLWSVSLPPGHPRKPPAYEEFLQAFPDPIEGEHPLPLLPQDENDQSQTVESSPTQPVFSPEKLERAQEIASDAWDSSDRERAITLAYKALSISPYCADAYNLLAEESRNKQEKVELFQKAVDVGRTALGELYFRKNAGRFWSLLETRPLMRAMAGLAQALCKTGKTGDAIAIFQEMLRLNPHDNQGIRYLLLSALLEEDRMADVARLIQDYNEATSPFVYANALWSFCTAGPGAQSDAYLREAIKANPYVPAYLMGEKYLPYQELDYFKPGDEMEAVWYLRHAMKAWEKRPEVLTWLRGVVKEEKR